MAEDAIVVKYSADVSELSSDLNKIEHDLRGIEKDSKASMGALAKEGNKASNSVAKIDKSVNTLSSSLSNLANKLPFADKIQEAKELGESFKGITQSVGGSTKAMQLLRVAIASTGIGALVLVLGSLVAYFAKTEKGAEAFERGLAQVTATVEAVIGRFARLGEGLVQLFSGEWSKAANTFATAFDGIGKEIEEASKSASDFTRELQDIEDEEAKLSLKLAKSRNEIQLLLIQARNRILTEEQRIVLLKKAEAIEKKVIDEAIKLQELKVAALEKENNLKLQTGQIDEGNKTTELLQAEIELENLKGNSLELLGKIQARIDAQAQAAAEKRIREEEELIKLREHAYDIAVKQQTEIGNLLDETRTAQIGKAEKDQEDYRKGQMKATVAAINAQLKAEQEAAQRREEMNKQALNELVGLTNQTLNSIADIRTTKINAEIGAERDANQKKTEQEVASLEKRKQLGLVTEEAFQRQKAKIDARAAQQEAALKRRQFDADQKAAISKININTGVAIIKTYAELGFSPAAILAIGGLIFAGEIQKATVRSQPPPKFKDGVIDYKGKGSMTSDENHVLISNRESIIRGRQTVKHKDALYAINDDYFEKYIHQNYVVPALKRQSKEASRMNARQASTAENIMSAIALNGMGDLSHLERLTKSNKKVYIENMNGLSREVGREVSRALANQKYMV